MKDTFITISHASEGIFKEKGSKFLAFAFPVSSEEDIKIHLDKLKKKYHDARHHCYAYILGADSSQFRANDDGEPNHSAGDPILGQIRSRDLTNTLVVVVRYFGGTKLGVPGLISAYKTAASDALENNTTVRKRVTKSIQLKFGYPDLNTVMRIVREFDLEIVEQNFEMNCSVRLEVGVVVLEEALSKISLFPGIQIFENEK